jgi:putative membrane protein
MSVTLDAATLTPRSDRAFFLFNALVSSAAVAFIAFILLRDRTAAGGPDLAFMRTVNAVCNGLSALCLVVGYVAIRRRAVHMHRVCMISAFILSSVFLAWIPTEGASANAPPEIPPGMD